MQHQYDGVIIFMTLLRLHSTLEHAYTRMVKVAVPTDSHVFIYKKLSISPSLLSLHLSLCD